MYIERMLTRTSLNINGTLPFAEEMINDRMVKAVRSFLCALKSSWQPVLDHGPAGIPQKRRGGLMLAGYLISDPSVPTWPHQSHVEQARMSPMLTYQFPATPAMRPGGDNSEHF